MAKQTHIDAARTFNQSSALLALSVLADSAIEHYRGSFDNQAMYTPLVTSVLSLAAGLHGGRDDRPARHHGAMRFIWRRRRQASRVPVFISTTSPSAPGGWSWHNLFYAAPIGAPMALLFSGALGAVAERLRDEPAREPQLFGMPAGRALGLLVSAGLVGTLGEVALLHFRGAFQNPAMYAPLSFHRLASALLRFTARSQRHVEHWFTRLWLRMTAALGFIGAGFHARGVARTHGGWRNWSQNLLNGPPLPAPPSFSALALAGLAALRLRETEK